MRLASVVEMEMDFAGYLKASKRGPVVVTRQGKPVAVLLATGDEEELERLLMGHSQKLQAILEAARKRFQAGAGIPHDTFWAEVERESSGKGKKRIRKRRKSTAHRLHRSPSR